MVFPRIDQKTCLKCIYTANLKPIVVEPMVVGDEVQTDTEGIRQLMELDKDKGEILCVLSTTSCFAPRVYDNVPELSKLCKQFNIYHVINNAYGLQCSRIAADICLSVKYGRVDALISSTDKNFMVPVGGSIVYGPKKKDVVDKVNKTYPGRANGGPVMDLFVTFLEMGAEKMKQLLKERKENFEYLRSQLEQTLPLYGERMLQTSKNNKISTACTLTNLTLKVFVPNNTSPTFFGSYLFSRRVSGVRVVSTSPPVKIGDCEFSNYGSSCEKYPHLPYFTSAAAIGQNKEEIQVFVVRLREAFEKLLGTDAHIIIK